MHYEPIKFCQGAAELYVVPAIHFNHVFAKEVNRICYDPDRRPEAVAVELGPRAAASAGQWLRELAGSCKNLPVMLGLLKRNKTIRASLRQKALQLQKETGRDLSELSPEILKRDLGYSGYSLLCLSPTDSIIEAMRCSIELDIPVFGLDLDDMADGVYRPVQVQDPLACDNLPGYIDQNARFAELQRDEEIDNRREIAMAARLKRLLQNYRRVVFTCGMAHWLRIRELLNDDSIKPSLMPETNINTNGEFKRVVVHPLIAVQYMELFPALAEYYEKSRSSINGHSITLNKRLYIDTARIFHHRLKKVYRQYFYSGSTNFQHAKYGQDIERLCDFEGYLGNLCLLNQCPVPDLGMTIKAAQEIMTSEFVRALSNIFMKFSWASLNKFPDCTLLSPPVGEGHESNSVVLINKDGYQSEKGFYIRSSHSNTLHAPSGIPFEWEKARELAEKMTSNWNGHTWRPYDRLISSMSLRAIENVSKNKTVKKTVSFEGSLLNGIDVKRTIRAYSRGDERYHVYDFSKEYSEPLNFIEGFPVVWILQPDNNAGADWQVLVEPFSYMEKYIKDKTSFERVARKYGCNMVSIIAYGKRVHEDGNAAITGISCDHHSGIIIFQPISWTNRQFARWAELTGYMRAPFCNDSFLSEDNFGDLTTFYRNKHNIRIGEFHWSTTLILLAIPFAKEMLTVVIPEGYLIDKAVHEKAKKYGVQVRPVSHKLFSQTELDRLSRCHLVPAITCEPECIYTEDVEKSIGELQTDNIHLVPQSLMDFGNMA